MAELQKEALAQTGHSRSGRRGATARSGRTRRRRRRRIVKRASRRRFVVVHDASTGQALVEPTPDLPPCPPEQDRGRREVQNDDNELAPMLERRRIEAEILSHVYLH